MRSIEDVNREILARLERQYLNEPDDGRDVSDAPCCEECGEYPEDDYLYLYDGEWICEDCLLEMHDTLDCRGELKYCESCGVKENHELYYHHDKAICIDCLFRQYKRKDIYLEG